ncbi:MAG: hypothetical protein M0C28_04865 [Candidatus Moduliflexus flocculans]|nr:hypothetical protein [Candidatus Moduliflexus flocculans]
MEIMRLVAGQRRPYRDPPERTGAFQPVVSESAWRGSTTASSQPAATNRSGPARLPRPGPGVSRGAGGLSGTGGGDHGCEDCRQERLLPAAN